MFKVFRIINSYVHSLLERGKNLKLNITINVIIYEFEDTSFFCNKNLFSTEILRESTDIYI